MWKMTRVDQLPGGRTGVLAGAVYGLTFLLCCAVCRRPWIAGDERWRAYHIGGEPYEPGESIVFYCPECAVREFDRD